MQNMFGSTDTVPDTKAPYSNNTQAKKIVSVKPFQGQC